MSVRILLAEDQTIIQEGLRALLHGHKDLDVIEAVADGRAAVERAAALAPDVVVMDVRLPGLNGMAATRRIVEANPEVRVVALSIYAQRRFVAGMFEAGASAYLLKANAFEELVAAIRAVIRGERYLSSRIPGKATDYAGSGGATAPLSPREREVLQLVAEGKHTKEVASALGISTKTADAHRQRIMKKLGLFSVAELTKYAVRDGLTPLEK